MEFYKRTLREVYGGNIQKMKDAGHFIVWTPERIKNCFSDGNGTISDLLAYIKNNREFCIFENVPQAAKAVSA